MTDSEFEQERERILAFARKWAEPLGLGWWEITYEYARDDYKAPSPSYAPDTFSAAYCTADWRYGHATIVFNMPVMAQQSDSKAEKIVVHELCHVLLNEMRWARHDDADHIDHEERVASTLARAFLWLRESVTEPKEQA